MPWQQLDQHMVAGCSKRRRRNRGGKNHRRKEAREEVANGVEDDRATHMHDALESAVQAKSSEVESLKAALEASKGAEARRSWELEETVAALEASNRELEKTTKENDRLDRELHKKTTEHDLLEQQITDIERNFEIIQHSLLERMESTSQTNKDIEEILLSIRKQQQLCAICLDNLASHLCLPCGHLLFCEGCAYDFKFRHSERCPYCRAVVNAVVKAVCTSKMPQFSDAWKEDVAKITLQKLENAIESQSAFKLLTDLKCLGTLPAGVVRKLGLVEALKRTKSRFRNRSVMLLAISMIARLHAEGETEKNTTSERNTAASVIAD
eukprot:TRINITY_DN111410_c0_g1_i1.p1 TRINITY_DN111410_c0_g1~~TRINITY_DN111410_c0_g1_i1.p1  ORF type:complete len:343 (-),score=71.29 TRINITY_DN111410_c0_g1_i1:121-1095(-)